MFKLLTKGVATNGIVNWSFYKELGQDYATEDIEKATAKYQELLNNFSKNNLKLVEDVDMDILVNASVDVCDCGGNVDLADIITNATAGSTVVLSANAKTDEVLTIDKDMTIDGNGHIISYEGKEKSSDYALITNNGAKLTIKNAIIDTNNKIKAIMSKAGSLTLDNVVIKDITAKCTNGAGVFATGKCELTLTNSTITGNVAAENKDSVYSGDVWIGAECTAIINSGLYNNVWINANSSSGRNKGGLTINDGVISNAWLEYDANYGADLTIVGGTIDKLYIASKETPYEEMMIINKPAAGKYQGGIGSNED